MTNRGQSDEFFMARALELARKAWGQTHPNPMVGALIVIDGEIVAEGWHRADGQPHAEREALAAFGDRSPEGATMYVTLEPCSTHGRTGACTDAIARAGIKRVVVGANDPNPAHAGRGHEVMRKAGIEVISGVLERECEELNLIFNHWICEETPLFAAKMAMTLDGKFAAASGHSQWVTGEAARENVMLWRRYFPAIAVGANTVIEDDPSLTSRLEGSVVCPIRFVFDRHLKTLDSEEIPKLYADEFRSRTIVLCLDGAPIERKQQLSELGVALWELPAVNGHLDWSAFRARCAENEIYGVYIEAGPVLATEVIETGKVDYLFVYKAPKFLADTETAGIGSARKTSCMGEAFQLECVQNEIFGDDVLTRGRLVR